MSTKADTVYRKASFSFRFLDHKNSWFSRDLLEFFLEAIVTVSFLRNLRAFFLKGLHLKGFFIWYLVKTFRTALFYYNYGEFLLFVRAFHPYYIGSNHLKFFFFNYLKDSSHLNKLETPENMHGQLLMKWCWNRAFASILDNCLCIWNYLAFVNLFQINPNHI